MHWQSDGREDTREILVVSSHALFADIVGDMVTRCGFTPTYPVRLGAPWLGLAVRPPCAIICDCAAPADGIQRLIVEASARHIPLVLSDARMQQRVEDGSMILPQRVAWLTFPMSRDAFAAMLEALLPPPAEVVHRVTASLVGVRIDAGVRVRPLLPTADASTPDPSESMVDRPRRDRPVIHDTPKLDDMLDLRSAIVAALAAKPVYDQSLRRFIWTYVTAERDAGTPPGRVIMSLTELVDAARITPVALGEALTHRVILWCVEAYFGQLGGTDVSLYDSAASHALPRLVSRR